MSNAECRRELLALGGLDKLTRNPPSETGKEQGISNAEC
jgi:hypothetical protein